MKLYTVAVYNLTMYMTDVQTISREINSSSAGQENSFVTNK